MSAETILIVFLGFVGAETVISLWLDWLNARHVLARADSPPERFRDCITPAAHKRAVNYTLARMQLGVVEEVIDTVVLVVFVLAGGLALVDRAASGAGFGPKATGLRYFAVVGLMLRLLSTPFRIYGKFVIEEHPDTADDMKTDLLRLVEESQSRSPLAVSREIPEDIRRQLEALGYVE